MRNPNGCRLVLLLIPSLFLLLPVGVVTMYLERYSSRALLSQTERNWRTRGYDITLYGPTTTDSIDFTNTDITIRINPAPTISILVVCIISFIVSGLGMFGIWELRRVEGTAKHQRAWSWIILFGNFIMIGTSIGVLGYARSVQSHDQGWQRYEDVSKDGQEFTTETWACQIEKFYPEQDWAGAACGTAKATRFLLIPMAIASLLAIGSLYILMCARGGLKWLVGGKGRYGGFDNIYEMQPTAPSTPYIAHPGPQWMPQPRPQWTPQTGPQWAPQPAQQWVAQPHQPWMSQPIAQSYNSGLRPEPTVFR